MNDKLPAIARVVNGWQMNTDTMGVYGNYYLKRAMVTIAVSARISRTTPIYPFNMADADGKTMDGASSCAAFTRQNCRPLNAFWSVTMYDAEGFQVANQLDRYAIGDRDALKYNADGSLDLYIQHDSPGADKVSNWLPSPAKGTLGVTMRLYAPKSPAIDGQSGAALIKRVH